jgi:methylenetetrahydrofolate reductase (NADPH)
MPTEQVRAAGPAREPRDDGDATAGTAEAKVPRRARLRDRLAAGAAVVVELVPWRGPLEDRSGERARALADGLREDPRIDAVSITDGAGGHAVLSPETFARDLAEHGQQTIVHVACRDRNRNELLSLGWRLATAGIENLLVVSGDYPVEGYLGVASPVFDLDSVALVHLYAGLNEGRIAEEVMGRPIVRDTTPHVADLGPMRGGGQPPSPADFFLGVAISPFKRLERELIPQYLKLELKVRTGARFAITQVGYDVRKLDELLRYLELRGLSIPVLANVFLLRPGSARVLHAGEVPGVTVTDELLALVERQAASPDKGAAFLLELAAKQVAVARGLGYAGVYLGGSMRHDDYGRVLELADSFGPDDWRDFVRDIRFSAPDTFWFFEDDPGTGLNRPVPRIRSRRGTGPFGGAPLGYRASRLVHDLAFAPGTPGFRLAGAAYASVERLRLGHAAHVAEQAVKIPLYDCRDCGDCSLPEAAYLCPESQCAKNQRNGPCGGSRDGECEIPGKPCLWARAYDRLRPYGEELSMLERPIAVADGSLRRTSAWANTFLGRDHLARGRGQAATGVPR